MLSVVWDSLRDVLKRGLRALAHGARVLAVNVYINAALSAKKRELKRTLLARFTVRQLSEIASRYGISERYEDQG